MEKLTEHLSRLVEQKQGAYAALSDEIWGYAEIAFQEKRSADALARALRAEGFAIAEGVAGIPTAFTARWGAGKPVVGFLGEYDALPALSQQAGVCHHAPIQTGGPGHGCGHNALGVGALAAAVAVKDYLSAQGLPGTVVYYGCPAEEDGSGKMHMARAGLFDELDLAITWHPAGSNKVSGNSSLAVISVLYEFAGQASHASGSPHLGRSALDACELMNVGVNYLREHVIPEARMHYAYRDAGGGAPNVVQDHAVLYYFLRAPKVRQAMELADRVADVARGAALMTGTSLTIRVTDALCDCAIIPSLCQLMQQCFEEVGGPAFDEAEQALAAQYQAMLPAGSLEDRRREREEKFGAETAERLSRRPLMGEVMPLMMEGKASPGSTDVGDVSYATPTVQLDAACWADGTVGHSWQVTGQVGTSMAHKGLACAAKVMALTAVRAMADPALLAKARAEYVALTGGKYICPAPDDLLPDIDGANW